MAEWVWRQQRERRLLRYGRVTGHPEIVEDVALSLAQGIPHREQALYEAEASVGRLEEPDEEV